MDIFSSRLGTVYCMAVPGQTRISRLRVAGFPDASVIINSLSVDQTEAVHLSQSIGGSARIVSLGTAPSQLKLSGIAPEEMRHCGGYSSTSGFADILSFYAKHRVGTYGKPIVISYGKVTFSAYVMGLTTDVGTSNGPLTSFSMILLSLDQINPNGRGSSSAATASGSAESSVASTSPGRRTSTDSGASARGMLIAGEQPTGGALATS